MSNNFDPLLSGIKRLAQDGKLLALTTPPAIILNVKSPATVAYNSLTGMWDLNPGGTPGIATYLGGLFGDGSDGSATCDGVASVAGMSLAGTTYTMTRNGYFQTLTVNAGIAINCAGFMPFGWTGNINGHMHADGGAGVSGSGFGAAGGGSSGNTPLGQGSVGGASGGNGATLAHVMGGRGGGPGGAPTAIPANYSQARDLLSSLNGYVSGNVSGTLSIINFNGGTGGLSFGGGTPFGGGGGGGVMVARFATLTGSGHISADGGAGANGGGGGYCAAIAHDWSAWIGQITAVGGAFQVGGNVGGAGLALQWQV